MITNSKAQVELALRQAGVSSAVSDDAIRTALRSIGWADRDIVMALYVLRQTAPARDAVNCCLNKVIRSEAVLTPAEISALLGIEVQVRNSVVSTREDSGLTTVQVILITLLSVAIAALILTILMYLHEIGPFYVAMAG